MARRKKSKKTSRRRRIGAMSFNANSPLVKFGSMAAGYFFGDKINALVSKVTGDKIDGKIVGIAQAGLGAYYLFMKKGSKNLPLSIAAGVVAGAGIKKTMASFGIGKLLSGYGDVPVLGRRRITGYQQVPVIGSPANNGYVAGYDTAKVPVMAGVNAGAADNGSGVNNQSGSASGYMG